MRHTSSRRARPWPFLQASQGASRRRLTGCITEGAGVRLGFVFERYTEPARRVLFFARFESSQYGALAIAPEHLLIGVLREPTPVVDSLLSAQSISVEALRAALAARMPAHPQVPVSVEIPFSAATKHALQYGADEADGLDHRYIGPEHLLLGLLREGHSTASGVLVEQGLSLELARQRIDELTKEIGAGEEPGPTLPGVTRNVRVRSAAFDEYVALIKQRVKELGDADDPAAKQELVDQILTALDSLQDRV